jgi:hypothetical protein
MCDVMGRSSVSPHHPAVDADRPDRRFAGGVDDREDVFFGDDFL